MKEVKVVIEFIKIRLKSTLIFRASSITGVVSSCVYAGINIFVILRTIYSRVDTILGWSREEVIVLQGIMMTILYLYKMMAGGGTGNLSYFVEFGYLDPFLTKPIKPEVVIPFMEQRIEMLPRILVGILVILYGLSLTGGDFDSIRVFAFVLSIILSFFVFTLFNFALNLVAFWNYRVYMLYNITEDLVTFANYPVRIFGRVINFLFLTLVPVGVVSNLPAKIILMKGGLLIIILHQVVVLALMYLIVRVMWHFGLKRYEGVGN